MKRRHPITAAAAALATAIVAVGCGSAGDTTATGKDGTSGGTGKAVAGGPSSWRRPLLEGEAARATAVPILMYHVISKAKPDATYPDLWVDPRTFADQIRALRRAGWEAVTMGQLWSAWHGSGQLPRKPIVISFDDGYLSHYTHALPVLRAAGWPGVLNLKLGNVGNDGIPAWMVRRLIRAGWEIDSHTISHPDLPSTGDAALRSELVGSRDRIEKQFGVRPWFFCYPAGKFDARVERAVAAAGYLAATTVEPGWAKRRDDRFALPRVRVNSTDGAASLLAKIEASRPS